MIGQGIKSRKGVPELYTAVVHSLQLVSEGGLLLAAPPEDNILALRRVQRRSTLMLTRAGETLKYELEMVVALSRSGSSYRERNTVNMPD